MSKIKKTSINKDQNHFNMVAKQIPTSGAEHIQLFVLIWKRIQQPTL
jgi:hypothetical protein